MIQNRFLLVLPFALMLLLGLLAFRAGGANQATMLAIGLFAGLALYHASFGFTSAWRRFILERKSAGLRAQLVMLAVTSLVFFPLFAKGEAFGHAVGGFVFPIGIALITGAFLFGIGMQLGGGCGSGTLFTIGGGSVRMLVTLAFFIIGSTLATAYSEIWFAWPKLAPVSLIETFGAPGGLALFWSALGLFAWFAYRAEKARHGTPDSLLKPAPNWLAGPWPLLAGALALCLVNIAFVAVQSWPWGITSAFALWGSKLAAILGFAPENWAYWRGDPDALRASVFADPVSVTDFGIMLGAAFAAMIAGKFRPTLDIPPRSLAAAILGGLLLGIGARLGTGCNIGAFFSGTVSGSLHGWVWLAFAFLGNMAGVRLRPLFRLG